MGMVGADVDQLRTLARTLTQAADRLDVATREVSGRLSATPWNGPDANRYRSQWQGESSALIRNVVDALRTAASTVERNATEQEQASCGGGSANLSGPFDVRGLSPSVPHTLPFNLSGGQPLQPFVSIRDFLNTNTIWPINNGMALGLTPLGPALPLIDALGIAGDGTLSPEEKIGAAAHSLADLGSGLLKDSHTPVGYWAGAAVAQWADVAQLTSEADFSPSALQTTGDYIRSDPGGAFEAARDAVIGYVPNLISNLLPAIPK